MIDLINFENFEKKKEEERYGYSFMDKSAENSPQQVVTKSSPQVVTKESSPQKTKESPQQVVDKKTKEREFIIISPGVIIGIILLVILILLIIYLIIKFVVSLVP